ncbi:MAG: threonine synthase [Candidatus Heimdallarchaeota archaeon]
MENFEIETNSISFKNAKLVCSFCGKLFPWESLIQRCTMCDEPLEVRYDLSKIRKLITKQDFEERPFNIWKYKEFLPFESFDHIISLYEGGTPLLEAKNLMKHLDFPQILLKDETRNPTSSFKDRGTSIGVTRALELGVRGVGTVSTGNMAASVAAYAAKAKLPCVILIPQNTSVQKIAQTVICGVNVVAVACPYSKMYDISLQIGHEIGILFINSDSPWRIEGQKTIAYEICDQLGWQTPDHLIVPVSSGGNISAIFKGFMELNEIGFINHMPHIIGVQAKGNNPIVKAYFAGKNKVEEYLNPSTIAHAIINPNPPSGNRVLKLLKRFRGSMFSVSDDEILDAQRLLATKEGIFAEPAGATPLAALKCLLEKETITKNDKVVCVITGHGLKDINVMADKLSKPIFSKAEDLESTIRSLLPS